MNRYLQVKTSLAPYNTYQNIRILHGSWSPQIIRPHAVKRKWNGDMSMSLGYSYLVWQGTCKLYHVDPDGASITYNEARAMFSNDTVAGNEMWLIDYDNVEYKVAFVGNFVPKNLSPILDSSESVWTAELAFEKRTT